MSDSDNKVIIWYWLHGDLLYKEATKNDWFEVVYRMMQRDCYVDVVEFPFDRTFDPRTEPVFIEYVNDLRYEYHAEHKALAPETIAKHRVAISHPTRPEKYHRTYVTHKELRALRELLGEDRVIIKG